MKKELWYIFVFVLLFMATCSYKEMSHLSDDELGWILSQELGDTTVFVSNRGAIDSAIIVSVNTYNRRNPFYFINENFPQTYEANASYDFTIRPQRKHLDGGLYIKKELSDSLTTIINFGARFTRNRKSDDIDYLSIPLNPTQFTCNGIVFDNCIVVDSLNSDYSEKWEYNPENRVEKFVISKKHGLIYYRFEDGEEFTPKFKQNPVQ